MNDKTLAEVRGHLKRIMDMQHVSQARHEAKLALDKMNIPPPHEHCFCVVMPGRAYCCACSYREQD